MKKIFLKKRGLTLVEVIVSLAILGIIVVPLLSLTLTSTNITVKSDLKVKGSNLAQSVAEYIKNTATDSLDLSSLKLYKSTKDKISYAEAGEDINSFALYEINSSEYKDLLIKIKFMNRVIKNENTDVNINLSQDNKLNVLMEGSNLIIPANYNVDKSKGTLNFSITYGSKDFRLLVTQDTTPILDYTNSSFNGDIVFDFQSVDNLQININAINESDKHHKLTCYKYNLSKVNSNLAVSDNFQVLNSTYLDDYLSINNGDAIEIISLDKALGLKGVLQKITIVKVKL